MSELWADPSCSVSTVVGTFHHCRLACWSSGLDGALGMVLVGLAFTGGRLLSTCDAHWYHRAGMGPLLDVTGLTLMVGLGVVFALNSPCTCFASLFVGIERAASDESTDSVMVHPDMVLSVGVLAGLLIDDSVVGSHETKSESPDIVGVSANRIVVGTDSWTID